MIVTLTTAGLCGIILLVLSLRVSGGRGKAKVSLGDGGDAMLLSRIRAQGNFVEYVPIVLILMGLIENGGGNLGALGIIGSTLVICRIAHAIGIASPAPNPGRLIGTLGTFIVLAATSIWALIVSAQLHHLV